MSRRPTVGEIAALSARLRDVASGRRVEAGEWDRILADKRELLDRIDSADRGVPDTGYSRSARDAARELAAEGRSLDEAEAMVSRYLDEVSEQVGAPVYQWGLDDADLDEIRDGEARRTLDAVEDAHEAVVAVPDPPAPDAAYAAAEDDVREDAAEVAR